MDEQAQLSLEKLFAEPFEPVWAKQQREAQEQAQIELALRRIAKENKWRTVLKEKVDLGWKLEAERSHQRIMANCRGVYRII